MHMRAAQDEFERMKAGELSPAGRTVEVTLPQGCWQVLGTDERAIPDVLIEKLLLQTVLNVSRDLLGQERISIWPFERLLASTASLKKGEWQDLLRRIGTSPKESRSVTVFLPASHWTLLERSAEESWTTVESRLSGLVSGALIETLAQAAQSASS